jgi:hypothetical protein
MSEALESNLFVVACFMRGVDTAEEAELIRSDG